MTKNYKKNIFKIIIRPKLNIRSRQWWIKKTVYLSIILKSFIPRENKVFKNSIQASILLTTNKEIQDLNKKYRKKNKATDVLSFHLTENEQLKQKYLGDIVISVQKARLQAKERSVSVEEELLMLLIHGFLHLIGYDHEKLKDEKIMFSLQSKILKKIMLT